jgi:hypothetical protein
MARYIPTAEVAKLIRTALKRAFPGVTFSVRSKVYSGGSSINVDWTDGPTAKQVEAIAKSYQGGRFDGMIDMAYSVDSYLMADGSAAVAHNPGTVGSMGLDPGFRQFKPAPDAERVHFSVSHVFCNRDYSQAMKQRALDSLRARYALGEDCSDVAVETNRWGRAEITRNPYLPAWNSDLATLLWRELAKRTSAKAAVAA